MPSFTENFRFNAHPFAKYVAESEPEIQAYAVTPPYFEETKKRTGDVLSFILFGFRGSGKSATRLTSEKDAWSRVQRGQKAPLVISLTDFEPIISQNKIDNITSNIIISHVAFLVVEALLLWISNQNEEESLLELLNEDEKRLFISIVKTHYLTIPDTSRRLNVSRTMTLLNQTWINRTQYWIEKKWEPISAILSKITSSASKHYADLDLPAQELYTLLQRDSTFTIGITVIERLVSCARSFGFSGICAYVDKVDETTKTGTSSELSAKLVYPILSQVQLMEIAGFSWIFFLWDKIKNELSDDPLRIRLDKFAFSEISWDENFLKEMVSQRLRYFSDGRISDGQMLCKADVNFEHHINNFINIVSKSPRELVRLFDVLVREYDVKYAQENHIQYLSNDDFQDAIESYIKNVVWTVYDRKNLSEILRLGMQRFINKDVQTAFKISDQGARNRIRNWPPRRGEWNCGHC
jgi:hypothetical protein